MTLSLTEVNALKRPPAVEGVLPVIHERWSPRAFSDREVSSADLHRIFEAARWAPSSNNEQPWRFLVGLRNTQTHSSIAAALAGYNHDWAPKAPVLILGMTRSRTVRRDAPNAYALYDLGAAMAMLVLQAQALGLATHQMGGFDHAAIRQSLGIPELWVFGSVTALGYQAEPAALASEEMIAREVAPRTRKPLSELAFTAWEEPATLGG